MTEMIERVAEAIRKEIGTRHQGLPKGGWDGLMKKAARAAIVAMREPTQEMIRAVYDAETLPFLDSDYQSMIDAALGDAK